MFFTIASLFVPNLGPTHVPVMDVVYSKNQFHVGADVLAPNPRKRIWTFNQFDDVVQFSAQNGLMLEVENSNLAQDVLSTSGRQPATLV